MRDTITLRLELAGVVYTRTIELGDSVIAVPEPPTPFLDTFESAVFKLKRREMDRQTLLELADRLAQQLADTLEDAQGWHGERRAQGVREAGRVT